MKSKVKKVMFLFIVLFSAMIVGCSDDYDSLQVQQNSIVVSGQLAPWEKERYNYSYLESGLLTANQYLSEQSLSLEELKQLHEIANLIFGEYNTKLLKYWDQRTENLMDLELFDSEYSRRDMYELLGDFDGKLELLEKAPNIQINLKHIGERNGFFCIPVRRYAPGVNVYHPGDEERTGIDDLSEYGWYYAVLLMKKDTTSKYGWKIFYGTSSPLGMSGPQGDRGPWIIRGNPNDDFSAEMWRSSGIGMSDSEWEYYAGKRDKLIREDASIFSQSRALVQDGGNYNRQAAASYSYTYALDYNTDYYFWKDRRNTDCANFASQCLAAGGLPQDEIWKYFYNKKDPYSSGTSAWRGASNLFYYLLKSGHGSKVKGKYLHDVYDGDPNWCSLQWGDLVFSCWKEDGPINFDKPIIRHVEVITHDYHNPGKYYKGAPEYYKLSGHTRDKRDQDIKNNRKFYKNYSIGIKIEY